MAHLWAGVGNTMTKTKTKTKRKKPSTVTRAYLNRKLKAMAKSQAQQVVDIQAEAQRAKEVAYKQGFNEGGNDEPALSWGSRGYRRSKATFRDESSTSQEAAAERMYRLWATNPMAKAMLEIKAEYVWGDGPLIQGDTDEIQELLDAHWKDSVNKWPEKGLVRVRDLSMYGELIMEAFVNKVTGRVRWGIIDVIEVEDIITNAENREEIIAIRTKQIALDDGGATIPPRLLKIITTDEETGQLAGVREVERYGNRLTEAREIISRDRRQWQVLKKNKPSDKFDTGWSNVRLRETCKGRAWRVSESESIVNRRGRRIGGITYEDRRGQEINGEPYDGQCFFFRVNTTSLGMRGRPDLLSLIDWLDKWDQLFYDFLDHAALLKDFVWDQLVTGGGDKPLVDFQNDFIVSQSQSGKVYTHNENVTLKPLNPDLKGADFDAMIQPLLQMLAGGARLPVHFLGSGGDANLATATAMSSPTHKGFATRQGIVKRMLTEMLQFVIDSAVAAGRLDEEVVVKDEQNVDAGDSEAALDEIIAQGKTDADASEVVLARDAFTVEMPAISEKDTAAAATVFAAVANAVTTLVQQGLMDNKIAVTFLARVAEMLDVDVDIDDWLERLEKLPDFDPRKEDALAGLLEGDGDADAEALQGAMQSEQQLAQPEVVLTPSMVQGALTVVKEVGDGTIDPDSGRNTLMILFGITKENAEKLLGVEVDDVTTNGTSGKFVDRLQAIINEGARKEPKGE